MILGLAIALLSAVTALIVAPLYWPRAKNGPGRGASAPKTPSERAAEADELT